MSNVPPDKGELRNPNQPYQQPVQPNQPQGFPQALQNPQGQPQQGQPFQSAPPQMQQPFPNYQQNPYGQPQYPQAQQYGQPQYGQAPYGQPQKSNLQATLSLVFSIIGFVVSILITVVSIPFTISGIILGHIALSRIKRSGEKGRRKAIAGLIIGYLAVLTSIIFIMLSALVYFGEHNSSSSSTNTGSSSSSTQTVAEGCSIFVQAVNNQNAAVQQTIELAKTDRQAAAAQLVTEADAIYADSVNVTNPEVRSSVDTLTSTLKTLGNDVASGVDSAQDGQNFQNALKASQTLCS